MTDNTRKGCNYIQQYYDDQVGSTDKSIYTSYRDDYRWRPDCNVDGSYAPKQCKGSKVIPDDRM